MLFEELPAPRPAPNFHKRPHSRVNCSEPGAASSQLQPDAGSACAIQLSQTSPWKRGPRPRDVVRKWNSNENSQNANRCCALTPQKMWLPREGGPSDRCRLTSLSFLIQSGRAGSAPHAAPLCTPATARPPAGLGRPRSAPRTRAHNAQRPPNAVTGMKEWWAGGRRPSSVPRGTLDGPPRIRDVKSQSTCKGRRTCWQRDNRDLRPQSWSVGR